jgi:energy-coupling factor transport system substrate-specific component
VADWDPLIVWLGDVRVAADDVSYGELARRVSERRREAGATPEAARVARSSVYDLFRPGRSRLNLELVREVAAVLGVPPGEVEDRIASSRNGSAPVLEPPTPQSTPQPTPDPTAEPVAQRAPGLRLVLAVAVACVAANVLGRGLVYALQLPLHLDMVGTAVAALVIGPWVGAMVGASTNAVGVLISGWTSLPFALVNIAGALVWGYGARAGLGRTLPRFAGLNVLVALVCTLVAVPILVLLFGGSVGNGQETIAATLSEMGNSLVVAVTGANILVSLSDKLISGFLALVVVASLPLWWQARVPLPFVGHGVGTRD